MTTPMKPHTRDGKISGVLSLVMSLMALGSVICFHFPHLTTTPQLREIYPVDLIRTLIWVFIGVSAVLGGWSYHRNPSGKLGLIGLNAAGAALLLGGGGVEYDIPVKKSNYVGLDWFILDLLLLSAIFVPLERLFPLHKEQPIFRPAFKVDFGYFFINHFLVQLMLLATAAPALWVQTRFNQKLLPGIADWHPLLQFLAILVAVDFFQYWTHRAFHQIPGLWKFHAVHHSVEKMDWLAGSRLHPLDIFLTRAVLFFPLTFLAFDPLVLQTYLVATAFGTVFTHSNIRWRFPVIERLITTPAYHHWHHSSERPAIDRNFAVHLPFLDRLFGTYYFPSDLWPSQYGLDRARIPSTMLGQWLYPFNGR